MSLAKEDLKAIEEVVRKQTGNLVTSAEFKKELKQEIKVSEDYIISRINREIIDLAEINRSVIDKIVEHDYKLKAIEKALKLEGKW